MKKYGYLGPKGTHCEEALNTYLGGEAITVPYQSIEKVISAVSRDHVSHGLVPLENSIEGTVNLVLDLINSDRDLRIAGEVILPISHNLLVRPGTPFDEISLIVSHPQALAQCRVYLKSHFPEAAVREVNSTAEAAQIASGGESGIAAIGSKSAAEYYGLSILEPDIQDCKENKTRFVMVSKEEAPETSRARTSVVISITDRPGGLYQILKEFALSSINLTKIESRPAKRNLGDYLFFIDLEGDYRNPIVRDCLEAIEDMAASFRVLGSYPVWEDTASNDKYTGKTPDPVSVDEIRQNIDIIDYQIVELLARRTQMVTMIGKLKYRWDTIRDQEREKEILNRVREIAARKGVSPELMEKVYRLLFDHFVELQVRQHTGTAHPQQC